MSEWIWGAWQRKNRRTRRKVCPNDTLSTTNPTLTGLRSNPGTRGDRTAADRLSYGTASTFIIHAPRTTDKVLTWQSCRYYIRRNRECVLLLTLNSSGLTCGHLAPNNELHKGVLCWCGSTGNIKLLYFKFVKLVTGRRNLGVLTAVTTTRQAFWDVAFCDCISTYWSFERM